MKGLAFCGACVAMLVAGCGPSAANLRDKGISEFQVGHVERAENFLQQALDREPAMSEALYYMGRIRHAQGEYEKAIHFYQCCLDADPGFQQARRWLDKALQQTGPTGQTLLFIP